MTEMPFSQEDDRLAEDIEGEVEVVPDEERLVDEPDPEPGEVLDEDRPVHTEDPTNQKSRTPYRCPTLWSGRQDLNLRPPVPKTGALPNCATSRA